MALDIREHPVWSLLASTLGGCKYYQDYLGHAGLVQVRQGMPLVAPAR
jgi:hypothetical protein